MKTNFTLLKSSLMILFLCLGLSSWGQETETLNCPLGSISNTEMVFTTDNFTITHAKGSDANFAEYSPWRVYTNNTVTFTGGENVQKITSIVITATSTTYATAAVNGTLTVVSGTGTVSGASSGSIATLTVTGDDVSEIMLKPSAQTRWSSITINYEVAPATPTITTDLTSLNMNTTFGTSVTSDLVVTGVLLTEDIDVSITGDGFSVNPTTLGSTGGTLTVTYNPTTVGTQSGTITLSNADADDVVVLLNGTATLAAPIAIAQPNYTTSNSFATNWNPVPGAETYEIDVYTIEETMGGFATDLFISEYVEGSSNNKYIEIYNGTGEVIDLSDYSIKLYANGASSPSSTQELGGLQATLAHGETIVLKNSSADLTLPLGVSVYNSGVCNFNGDDAIGLYKNDILLDSFGNIGTQSNYGTDITLRRNSTIFSPNIIYTENEWTSFPTNTVDNLGSHTFEGGASIDIVYHLQNQNVGSSTAYMVTELNPETTYYYVVRAVVAGTETSANSNVIEVTTTVASTIVTWTGTEWINGTPSIDEDVIIEGLLTVGEDYASFEAKTLTVDTGTSIYIREGSSITVAGVIENQAAAGNFIVDSGASLVQIDEVDNIGEITVFIDSQPMKRLDYTLWSSPVEGMLLKDFSEVSPSGGTGTIWNRVFTLGETSWDQVWETQSDFQNDNTTTFTEAQGYLYRSRNDYPATEAFVFQGEFVGIPHNGTKTITTSNAYDAVGNPYPSTLDANLFLFENSDVDALYFWTNTHAPVEGSYDGVPNNWASYTTAGGTAAGSSATPNGLIATGQGFVVENLGASVTFTNEMRTLDTGMFFKTMGSEKHRLWLNLSIEDTMLNQMMVAYMDGATEGVDAQIDGKMFSYAGSALYSIITDQEDAYAIQGRSLPFTNTDVVALGFRAVQAGTYTVSLADFDGLFSDGQDIYLKDNATQTYHDLKDGAYTFVSDQGIFDSRFEVVYQADGGLSTNNPNLDNKWIVYSQDNGFQIEVQGFELKEVLVYDMLGRLVYNNQAEGTSHAISNIANGVLIVKVITTDNQVLTRKTAK